MAGAAPAMARGHSGPRSQRTGVTRNRAGPSRWCRTGIVPAPRHRLRGRGRRTPPPGSYSARDSGSRRTAKALQDAPRLVAVVYRSPCPAAGGRSDVGMAEAHQRPEGAPDLGRRRIRRYVQCGVVATGVAIHAIHRPLDGPGRGPGGAGCGRRRLVPALIDGLAGVASAAQLLPDLLHLVLRVRDFNLPRLGPFQHRNAERQDAVGVVRLDLLGVQGVAQDELAAEDAARPLRGNQFNVGLASDRAVQPGRSGRCARCRGPPSQR